MASKLEVGGLTTSSDITIGSGGSTPDLIFAEGDSQITGPANANFLIKSRGNSAAEGLSLHGADGAGIEVNKAGDVGIGVVPSAALDVETSSDVWAAEIRQTNASNGDGLFVNTGSTASADYVASFRANDVNIFDIKSNGAINAAGLATFANGIACSGGGVTTSANFGQIKTSTSTAITSGSTIPISSSNANGSLVTVYEGSSGKVIVFLVSFANVVIISDPGSYGSVTDVSDKFCMLGGGSHTCILKNGFSGDKTVQIMAMGCGLE